MKSISVLVHYTDNSKLFTTASADTDYLIVEDDVPYIVIDLLDHVSGSCKYDILRSLKTELVIHLKIGFEALWATQMNWLMSADLVGALPT